MYWSSHVEGTVERSLSAALNFSEMVSPLSHFTDMVTVAYAVAVVATEAKAVATTKATRSVQPLGAISYWRLHCFIKMSPLVPVVFTPYGPVGLYATPPQHMNIIIFQSSNLVGAVLSKQTGLGSVVMILKFGPLHAPRFRI